MAEGLEGQKMEERSIPVFTVLKNNTILKNIYLLENPPSISSSLQEFAAEESEMEGTLVIGRHPDCNITLEHPSISRFHLRIHFKPSSRSLAVTDLFSGHGTWISGKRIDPGMRVKLNEGDRMQLGGSSRVYKLHWVPLSCAFDLDYPVGPRMDASDRVEETGEEKHQDEDGSCCEKYQMHTLDDQLDGLKLLFSDKNLISTVEKMSPLVHSAPEDTNNSFLDKEVETKSSFAIDHEQGEKSSTVKSVKRLSSSIWSRRGKLNTVQIQTGRDKKKIVRVNNKTEVKPLIHEIFQTESVSKKPFAKADFDEEQTFTPEKGNYPPDSLPPKSSKNKVPEVLKSAETSMMQEDEISTVDKENKTPNSLLLRSINKIGKSAEVKHPKSYQSLPLNKGEKRNINQQKEKHTRKVLQEQKSVSSASKSHARLVKEPPQVKCRADKSDPFQSLLVNSTINSSTSVDSKRWTIIVDTVCLLNKRSRNELQLLRGLKWTTLIIPRTVVKELDCMLRREKFFWRKKEVSAALQWVEDCMEKVKWWIHVQSSAEEGRSIAPTPPASPFRKDNGAFSIGSVSFSPYSLQGVVIPTAHDHILECALFFKRIRNDGRLALLSENDTLKIKAMAEGVICETAENFRRSLVNPFSERFLYTNGSPRGPTWSCLDDVVLKEKYYPSPSKKLFKPREGLKGLKLILMHN